MASDNSIGQETMIYYFLIIYNLDISSIHWCTRTITCTSSLTYVQMSQRRMLLSQMLLDDFLYYNHLHHWHHLYSARIVYDHTLSCCSTDLYDRGPRTRIEDAVDQIQVEWIFCWHFNGVKGWGWHTAPNAGYAIVPNHQQFDTKWDTERSFKKRT